MNLEPLAQKLEDDGVGIQARTVFIGMMPAHAPTGILLRNKLQGTEIDYELPGYYKTGFQLIARGNGYSEAFDLINAAINSLKVSEAMVGAYYIRHMRPKTLPVMFPLSKGNLLEFSCDFEVVFSE